MRRVSYFQTEDGEIAPIVNIDNTNVSYFQDESKEAALIDTADLNLDDVGEVTIFFLTTYSRETEQNPAYLTFRGEQAKAVWAHFQGDESVETLTDQ